MGSFQIEGGHKLKGAIIPQGAKNETLVGKILKLS